MFKRTIYLLIALFLSLQLFAEDIAFKDLTYSKSSNFLKMNKVWTKKALQNALADSMILDETEMKIENSEDVWSEEKIFGEETMPAFIEDLTLIRGVDGEFSLGNEINEKGTWGTGYVRGSYNRHPYSKVGKVFFQKKVGGVWKNYVCSGSVVYHNLVLTAGHCVSNGKGKWHRNIIFIPRYRNGSEPKGRWYARKMYAFKSWHTKRKFARDVGFIITHTKSGRTLGHTVGWLGTAWNYKRKGHRHLIGYPVSWARGQYMVETKANISKVDLSKIPWPSGVRSSLTGGSSGGPWIKSGSYANGINSYRYGSKPYIYSPYFDTSFKKMMFKARNAR